MREELRDAMQVRNNSMWIQHTADGAHMSQTEEDGACTGVAKLQRLLISRR